jgi:hypothetical protein
MLIQWFGSIAGYLDASKKGADQKKKHKKINQKKPVGRRTQCQYPAEDNCPRAKIQRAHLTANTKRTAVQEIWDPCIALTKNNATSVKCRYCKE